MRVFIAGATGVIGIRLVPLLLEDGHAVIGMTRSPEKAAELRALGATPAVCDVFDAEALLATVRDQAPDAVVHQLTDLPDRLEQLDAYSERNDRIRVEGTRNLVAAARAAGARHVVAQSIAWRPPGREHVVEEHERLVLEIGGVVVRYGRLYGPGTYYEGELPPDPRIHVDAAARETVPLLTAPAGVVELVDRDGR